MFRLLGVLALLLNVLLWWRVRRELVEAFPRRGRLIGWALIPLMLVLLHPALLMATVGWSGLRTVRTHLPDLFLMAAMGAQIAVLLYWILAGAVAAVRGIRKLVAKLAARPPERAPLPALASLAPIETIDRERRALSLALPLTAIAISTGGVVASRQAPVVTRIQLPVRREFTHLHGLTIAQVSDVHVGSYMDAARLDEIRDALNWLRADYHVITGDLLDNHVSQLELAQRFIRGLSPRRERPLLCMGNHEYIAARSADVGTIVRGLEEAGARMLIDSATELRVGADRIWLGGLDYPPRSSGGRRTRPTSEGLERVLAPMRDDGAPRIVLSHHPRTFRRARELPIDLMLSGHTHGGQIKLGRIGDYALTPVLPMDFYHNGLYRHGERLLYVNAGAGGWLPLRINCPPEITLIELVAA